MAIKWGNWSNGQSGSKSRLGITRSTNTTASQITVAITVHFEFAGYYANSSGTLTLSGGHSVSKSVPLVFSGSGTRNLGTYSQTFTRPWGSTSARSTQISISGFAGGNPSIGEGYNLPRRIYLTPATPSSVTAGYVRDGVASLAWSVTGSTSAPVTSVQVARQSNNNSWGTNTSTFSQRSGSTTFSNLSRGNRYRWRVRGRNQDATGSWRESGWVYMRPLEVANVVATRSGSSVNLSWVNRDAMTYAGYRVYDNSTLVATLSAGTTTYTHTNPSTSTTHRYSVRAYYGSLQADHVYSNTVQLLSAPKAPTNLNPNGGYIVAGSTQRVEWDHNSVDTTGQTAYQVRVRKKGNTTWTTYSGTTTAYRDITVSTFAGHDEYVEWQVRTKGDHADYSPWSAISSFGVASRPTVTITGPAAGAIITGATAVVGLTFSRAPISYEIELRDGSGQTVRTITGHSANTTISVPVSGLNTDQNYTVRVTATDRVSSVTTSRTFSVEYEQPLPPTANHWWETDVGEVHIDAQPANTGISASVVIVEKLVGEEWQYVGEWYIWVPITVVDREASLGGGEYRAVGVVYTGGNEVRSAPTYFTVEPIPQLADFVNFGENTLRVIHLPGISRAVTNSDIHLIDLDDGTADPVAVFGVKERHTTTVSGLLMDMPGGSARDQARAFRELGTHKDLVLLRTIDAEPVWGIVTGITQPRELWGGYQVSFTHTKAR